MIHHQLTLENIVAISTANGRGAIGIVRVTGPSAFRIVSNIFVVSKNKFERYSTFVHSKAHHGYIINENNQIIDEVVVVAYKSPNSYTGHDLIEINCHGNSLILDAVIQLLINNGARPAQRGEFTKYAYLNGKLDLIQAESVLDIIQAKTLKTTLACVNILSGFLGDKINKIKSELLELITNIAARLDFPDEVEEINLDGLNAKLEAIKQELMKIAKSAQSGRYMRDGLKIAILGNPNSGKSSLLNKLLDFDRAIVSAQPGTTRDFIEEPLDLAGIPVVLVDTAGIRHTSDSIEQIGIDRSISAASNCDLILVVNALDSNEKIEPRIIECLNQKPFILVNNKCDLNTQIGQKKFLSEFDNFIAAVDISAKNGDNVESLINLISSWVNNLGGLDDYGVTLNQRQGYLCNLSLESLNNCINANKNDLPLDCLATDLTDSINYLSQIAGTNLNDEIINNVFANFCVGK